MVECGCDGEDECSAADGEACVWQDSPDDVGFDGEEHVADEGL